MTRRRSVQVDPAAISMSAAIRVAAQASPLLVITGRALGDLASELGGWVAAAEHLLALAEQTGNPIGINFETSEEASRTMFLPPPGWSEEKLAGWIGGHHAELEAQFGQVTRLSNRAERRRRQREGRS